ncbi:MAG: hypothetical protein P4L59_09870 [Desulfosporosinus sp.]|nr:hypothetical protein [Desulfosporosinus sp.]
MINTIFSFIQNVTFELSPSKYIKGLSILALITGLVIGGIKIVRTIIKERIIDEHMRETRARIARVATEIEVYKEVTMSEVKDKISTEITHTSGELTNEVAEPSHNITETKVVIESVKQHPNTEDQSIQSVSAEIPKGKKTRAMSMEERWAEFDKKRSRTNTA